MTEYGYELLFRDSTENRAAFSDPAQATAEVIVNAFIEIGLEEIVGPRFAFINFDRNLILGNYCESLPPERVVLEILESVSPDAAVLKKLQQLRGIHHRIALDDYTFQKSSQSLLEIADFVKLDVLASDAHTLERSLAEIKKYSVEVIAEKVETVEQFERYKALGFDLFQGFFFCAPQIVEGRRQPIARSSAIALMIKVNNPELDVKELAKAISQDPSLSYKLLRYINSAIYSLRRPVASIEHAITLLGHEKIRTWASLILLSSFSDKLHEVIVSGAVRASMCEQIARTLKVNRPHRIFLVGLLSVLDVLTGQPLDTLLKPLPLEKEVLDAAVYQRGVFGHILRCVVEYEKRHWEKAEDAISLGRTTIEHAYEQALKWGLTTLSTFKMAGEDRSGTAN
jgi:EAL and modified HD-GYP domain-containing signal transduction protein